MLMKYLNMFIHKYVIHKIKQAGAELGQAQLKLGLDFTLIFCWIQFCRVE